MKKLGWILITATLLTSVSFVQAEENTDEQITRTVQAVLNSNGSPEACSQLLEALDNEGTDEQLAALKIGLENC